MAQTGKKWYVLRAVSGKEGKVKEYLEALMKKDELLAANVGEILLPTEKYAQLRNGKRVVKEKLFLPGKPSGRGGPYPALHAERARFPGWT